MSISLSMRDVMLPTARTDVITKAVVDAIPTAHQEMGQLQHGAVDLPVT